MSALGTHILVEFLGCKPEHLNDVPLIEKSMVKAASTAGATVINSTFHHFSPYGVSGVVVIQESHLAIHCWPEYQYAAVDLFTCGDTVDPWISFDYLKKALGAQNYSALEMKRGAINLLERVDFDLKGMREEALNYINPDKYNRDVWITDKDKNQALSLRYTGEILYNKKTPYQHVKVIDTYAYGKTLIIDNMVMCTETDEAHYHEMIVHPAMLSHGNVKDVLVIGGGDGGTIRELVKHETIEKIKMVEIDEAVIEASKLHLPSIASQLNNPKAEVIIGDGIAYLSENNDNYDAIIIDGSDPVGPAKGLFSEAFLYNCKNALNNNGMLIMQAESPMFNQKTFVEINQYLKKIFGTTKVHTFLFSIPTYPSGIWSIQIAVKGNMQPNIPNPKGADFCTKNNLKYYSTDIHKAAFTLPPYIQKLLS